MQIRNPCLQLLENPHTARISTTDPSNFKLGDCNKAELCRTDLFKTRFLSSGFGSVVADRSDW